MHLEVSSEQLRVFEQIHKKFDFFQENTCYLFFFNCILFKKFSRKVKTSQIITVFIINIIVNRRPQGGETARIADIFEIKQKILTPAIEEINKITDLNVEWKESKKIGKKVTHIRFEFTKKDKDLLDFL